MTFYEAAVEVLRRSGRPLHYKKITEIAVREQLLSHVGKTPHVTMGDRLEREIKKNEDTVIDQMRPGVFKLDESYAKELTQKIQKERKEKKRERQQQKKQKQRREQTKQTQTDEETVKDDDTTRRQARGSQRKAERKQKQQRDSTDDGPKRRRTSKGQDDGGQPKRQRGSSNESASEPSPARQQGRTLPTQKHLEEGPVALSGIPKAAHQVLDERDEQPMPIDELADAIFERDLVKFHTHDPVTTVTSALANDNQVRQQHGHRPLFEHDDDGRWSLTEWKLDDEIVDKEQGILGLSEEIRQSTVQQLGDSLLDLKSEALEHLALTLLERLGYHNIKVSKRSSDGDVFFTADWRQGLADVRVCVQVATGEKGTLQPGAVNELRETLNHYSASEGVIIHLGEVSDDAVDHSRKENQAPITLLDRDNFVELLLKHGIGVQEYNAPLTMVDTDFIDALRD